MMNNNTEPQKKRSLFRSFEDAFRGIWDCIKSERNMRIHATACVYVLVFAALLKLERMEIICLIIVIGLVTATEALNTALEKLCDFTQKSTNPKIRVIKDISAGAVLLSAITATAVGIIIFIRPELFALLKDICTSPLKLVVLIASVAAALVFIFIGPARLFDGKKK